jgi:adenosine deaminase
VSSSSITLKQFYHLFPKADLHYHLLGGVRLETMLSLAQKYHEPLTEQQAKCYYRAYQHETGEVKGGIAALEFLYELMREPEDYFRVLIEVAEDAHACGVRYIETFWNPSDTNLSYPSVTESLINAIDHVEAQMGMIIRLIPAINREKSPEEAIHMVEQMIGFPHPYVLGIGIDYKEHDAPVELFEQAYKLAHQHGYQLTAHCSEFGLHWRNLQNGLDRIPLDRIDHGYTIIDNPELTQRCAQSGIPFTVIPSNTYYLNMWPEPTEWAEKHPIRAMAKAGLNIIPCTDDWHIHNTTSARCYQVMVDAFGFDLASLRQMVINSIQASWISEDIKNRWEKEWPAEFDRLRANLMEQPHIPQSKHIAYRK